MKVTEIEHFSHRHKLELSYSQKPYRCDGCKQEGFGSCYQCNKKTKCDFHLHEKCAMADPLATHPFFNNCIFEFRKKRKHGKRCKACGKDIRGFMYKSKKAYLHPCCLKLPNTLNGEGGLILNLKDKASSKCLICRHKKISGKVKGWAYVSTCGKHCYHVGCVNHMNFENWGCFNSQQNGGNISLVFIKQESGRKKKRGCCVGCALDLIVNAILGSALQLAAGCVLGLS
ncbi:uncharacterized protein LOC111297603 [Durio zibethinus]|uniref:Uncharacterized protein LOC111297603 n=1 Tax=Durio zibethinus TaxID=66656 RepID=A0A6P5Z5J7_DURZI|nr:uncharacterized protein LOC111297603 [Durio zibethinus]